jgi:hypothetical protein
MQQARTGFRAAPGVLGRQAVIDLDALCAAANKRLEQSIARSAGQHMRYFDLKVQECRNQLGINWLDMLMADANALTLSVMHAMQKPYARTQP